MDYTKPNLIYWRQQWLDFVYGAANELLGRKVSFYFIGMLKRFNYSFIDTVITVRPHSGDVLHIIPMSMIMGDPNLKALMNFHTKESKPTWWVQCVLHVHSWRGLVCSFTSQGQDRCVFWAWELTLSKKDISFLKIYFHTRMWIWEKDCSYKQILLILCESENKNRKEKNQWKRTKWSCRFTQVFQSIKWYEFFKKFSELVFLWHQMLPRTSGLTSEIEAIFML